MATKLYSLIPIALIVSFCINSGSSLPCPGCLELDELSFGKILRKFNTLLVKFDSAYPFGDKHEQYARFSAQVTPDNENLAIGLIGVKDYGDKDNMALANKYRVGDNYPAIKLFQNGDAENWIDFPKDLNVTVDNLKQFVRRHANVYMALSGCVQKFDDLAAEFARAAVSDTKTLGKLVSNAESELNKLKGEKDKFSGKVYVLYMKRIQEKGWAFVTEEIKRLQKLLGGKVADTKKAEINQKLNILSAFKSDGDQKTATRNEL